MKAREPSWVVFLWMDYLGSQFEEIKTIMGGKGMVIRAVLAVVA